MNPECRHEVLLSAEDFPLPQKKKAYRRQRGTNRKQPTPRIMHEADVGYGGWIQAGDRRAFPSSSNRVGLNRRQLPNGI